VVLCRYLRTASIAPPVSMPPLRFLSENRPLRDFARYVKYIENAKASGEGDFATWSTAAYQALSRQMKDVADHVATLGDGPQRALLFAVAMLHGAHPDIVYRASASLLKVTEHPPDEYPALQGVALSQRLRQLHAELDSSGNVRFTELGYDSAVRAYLWANFPGLHDQVREWVGETADADGLLDSEREELVGRFTEQCLPDRYQSTWVSLVKQCTTQRATPGRMKAAIAVLERGIRDEKHGRIFRRQIYDWSTTDGLSDRLAAVIVAACRDQMAVSHPDEALVRLHHVARREHGTRAREALLPLAGQDRRIFRQLMIRLTDTSPERRRWASDIGLFLELADAGALTEPGEQGHALIDDGGIRQQLAEGWSRACTSLQQEAWVPWAEQWLDRAAEDSRYRDVLLDVLVEGSGQRTAVLGRLYVMSHRHPSGAIVSDLLLQKSDAAQGIQAFWVT
jgi:hypothetical protein